MDLPQERQGKYKKNIHPLVRFARVASNVTFILLLVLMLFMVFFLAQSKITGKPPAVAGYQMYIVLSGSMRPAFDTGSIVLVRPLPVDEIKQGDIITYRSSAGRESLTTHRVVDVHRDEGLSFTTRGDANNVNDPERVPAGNVIGKVNFAIPYAGYVLSFAQTKQGFLTLILVPGIFIIVLELRKIFIYAAEMEKEKKKRDAERDAVRNKNILSSSSRDEKAEQKIYSEKIEKNEDKRTLLPPRGAGRYLFADEEHAAAEIDMEANAVETTKIWKERAFDILSGLSVVIDDTETEEES